MLASTSALALSLLSLPLLASADAFCADVILSVAARSEVNQFTLPPNLLNDPNALDDALNSALGLVGQALPLIPVEGSWNLSATYCEPCDGKVADTVQLLSHGGSYTKRYWTGHGLTSEKDIKRYSWAHYAAEQGYASLSIDRLGQGNTRTSADPILEVQLNMQAEVAKVISDQLQEGKVVGMTKDGKKIGGRKFKKVVYVGHSLGSMIGTVVARRHPGAFDAFILTGWAAGLPQNFIGVALGILLPAPLVDATRWGDLSPAHLAFTNKQKAREFFLGKDGTFDPAVWEHDWATRSTIALAELLGVFAGMNPSPQYDGPVQVLIGEYDVLLCDKGPRCAPGSENTPGNAADIFPGSRNYTYSITPKSGHNLNFQYSARDTYAAAHEFIRHNVDN